MDRIWILRVIGDNWAWLQQRPVQHSADHYARRPSGTVDEAQEADLCVDAAAIERDFDAARAAILKQPLQPSSTVPDAEGGAVGAAAAPSSNRARARPPVRIRWFRRLLDMLTCGLTGRHWRRLGRALVTLGGPASAPEVQLLPQSPEFHSLWRIRWHLFAAYAVAMTVIVGIAAAVAAEAVFSVLWATACMFVVESLAHCLIVVANVRHAASGSVLGMSAHDNQAPQMMTFLMTPTQPEFMISYAWRRGRNEFSLQELARSLATLLPNCWLDFDKLAAGDYLPAETASAAAHSRVLIILVTMQYVASSNCMTEFYSALRHRRHPQRTFVLLCTGTGSPADIPAQYIPALRDICVRASFTVCYSPADLLALVDLHALHCGDPRDMEACLSWWIRYGSAKSEPAAATTIVVPRAMMNHLWGIRQPCTFCLRRRSHGSAAVGFYVVSGNGQQAFALRKVTRLDIARSVSLFATMLLVASTLVPQARAAAPWLFEPQAPLGSSLAAPWGCMCAAAAVSLAFVVCSLAFMPKLDFRTLANANHYPLLALGHLGTQGAAFKPSETFPAESPAAALSAYRPVADLRTAAFQFQIVLVAADNSRPFTQQLLFNLRRLLGNEGASATTQTDTLANMLYGDSVNSWPQRLRLFLFVLDSADAIAQWHKLVTRPPPAGGRPWAAGCMVMAVSNDALQSAHGLPVARNHAYRFLLKLYDETPHPETEVADTSLVNGILDALSRKVATVFQLERQFPPVPDALASSRATRVQQAAGAASASSQIALVRKTLPSATVAVNPLAVARSTSAGEPMREVEFAVTRLP